MCVAAATLPTLYTNRISDYLSGVLAKYRKHIFRNWAISQNFPDSGGCSRRPTAQCLTLQEGVLQEGILQQGILQEGILREDTLQEHTLQEHPRAEATLQEGSLREGSLREGTLPEVGRLPSRRLLCRGATSTSEGVLRCCPF